jgi:hypothetical protein
MISPAGTPNLEPGEEYDRVARIWNRISRSGRDLLLRELDVAFVISDVNGDWRYRTSRVPTLRLYNTSGTGKKADFENLSAFINLTWFVQLTGFYLLYADSGSSAAAFGELLARVQAKPVPDRDKQWFRAIVGADIRAMDSTRRNSLVLDPKYGKEIVSALAAADEEKKEQFASLIAAMGSGAKHTIDLKAIAFALPKNSSETTSKGAIRVNVVGGKKLLEWDSTGGTVFLALARGDSNPIDFTADNVSALLKSGKAEVYIGAKGTPKIARVKVGK